MLLITDEAIDEAAAAGVFVVIFVCGLWWA